MEIEAGKPLCVAATKAKMDEKTARRYRKLGMTPGELNRPRGWKTREDPFDGVWQEVVSLLGREPKLRPKTLFEELLRRHPGRFQEGQIRTLQRRIKHWRATCGPAKEVVFPQVHEPGRLCASDFTHCSSLGVTIGRVSFDHLLFHFVLTCSNWEHASICFSETFEALSEGLQAALRVLGGAPERHRTDQLSAAVRQFRGGEAFTVRYEALLSHYGIVGEKTQPASPHENGDSEQSHNRLKDALDQALMLRGSRDFNSREDYEAFLGAVMDKRNAGRGERLEEERLKLRPLPKRGMETCRDVLARVGPSSTIRVAENAYSVPSRLIGEMVTVRLYSEHLDIWLGGTKVEGPMARLRGKGGARIDYRHLIDSLSRKPGAFARYYWREELFPTSRFRMAFDSLTGSGMARPDKEYLAILALAAGEGEALVDEALRGMIDAQEAVTSARVKQLVADSRTPAPPRHIHIDQVAMSDYDLLLAEAAP